MNPIHRCFQKILPGNHISYVRDRTYGTYGRTDKGDAICPPPIINGGGIKIKFACSVQTGASLPSFMFKIVIIFLIISLNIYFGCLNEPSFM